MGFPTPLTQGPFVLRSWSSWDHYARRRPTRIRPLVFEGSWEDALGFLDEAEIRPGFWGSLRWSTDDVTWIVEVKDDSDARLSDHPWEGFSFRLDKGVWRDPLGVYPALKALPGRSVSWRVSSPTTWKEVAEAAVLTARNWPAPVWSFPLQTAEDVPKSDQRDLLLLLLESEDPEAGFESLRDAGFLQRFWPELLELERVQHTKEHHPEGDGWAHTLETFRHRKDNFPELNAALLLHDIGKTRAVRRGANRFDGHAELGAETAETFLRRLDFSRKFREDVAFLVRYHMLPGLLARLRADSLEHTLTDPRFPWLLELYRCDLAATWKEPRDYHEACGIYRSFLKSRPTLSGAVPPRLAQSRPSVGARI